jgi:hypothetical protein
MIKQCKHCELEFDINSRRKLQAGGYINECPDCVEQNGGDHSPPKHFGVTGSCGSVRVRQFDSEQDRKSFQKDYLSTKTLKDYL